MKTLIYDGSFNGFLTTVYKAFDEKIEVADIQKNTEAQRGLFSDTETVFTQMDKAKRVWSGMQKKGSASSKNIYFAFLSENKGVELLLYRYILKLFSRSEMLHLNFTDTTTLKISQLAKSVGKEKHCIENSVTFQLTKDHIHFANIEPDFDVLPLITKHFRSRYTDQPWIIYDVKRKYGIYYNLETVEIISLNLKDINTNSVHKSTLFSGDEYNYQEACNSYFKSTNIKSRINIKLYTQHVPKRYWKYLSEKKQAV